jgi:hypothetical protein
MVHLLVPPAEETGPEKVTLGKIYIGKIILWNWREFGDYRHEEEGISRTSSRRSSRKSSRKSCRMSTVTE